MKSWWSIVPAAVFVLSCQSSPDGAEEAADPASVSLEPAPPSGGTAHSEGSGAETDPVEEPAPESEAAAPTAAAGDEETGTAARTDTGGTPCTTSADCGPGETCFGPEGCDVQWTCVAGRRCTRDRRPYCTCDGRTVHGSGSCPPEPYSKRGPC